MTSLTLNAWQLKNAVNQRIEELKLVNVLRACARDALLTQGVAKVGVNYSRTVEVGGYRHDVGEVFVDSVDLDDWVQDMSATIRERWGYCGNKYRLTYDELEGDESLIKSAVDKLLATRPKGDSYESMDLSDKVAGITLKSAASSMEGQYKDGLEVMDVWLPMDRKFITIPAPGSSVEQSGEPILLRELDWVEPEHGPYHILSFTDAPANGMSSSDVSALYDLHMVVNAGARKIVRKAERQKTVGLGGRRAQADGDRIVDAKDGEYLAVDDPAGSREVSLGGPDQTTFAYWLQLKREYSQQAGNLDLMGGLAAQSGTLGQDEMLQGNSSRQVADMQNIQLAFTTDICRDMAWYIWNDPALEMTMNIRVPGLDVLAPANLTAESKRGDWFDYYLDVQPYSMQPQTPATRLRGLLELLQTLYLPALPYMNQQGLGLDWREINETIREYRDYEELERWITYGPTVQAGADSGRKKSLPNPLTHKINERISRPGASVRGAEDMLVQSLMGAKQEVAT